MTLLEILYAFCDSDNSSDSRLENRNYRYLHADVLGKVSSSIHLYFNKVIIQLTVEISFLHFSNI